MAEIGKRSAAVVGKIDAGRERHARPAGRLIVSEVLIPREVFARGALRRVCVIGAVIPTRPARGARVEKRARPHCDAGGTAPILVITVMRSVLSRSWRGGACAEAGVTAATAASAAVDRTATVIRRMIDRKSTRLNS